MHYFNTVLYWKRCANILGEEGAKLKKSEQFFTTPLKMLKGKAWGVKTWHSGSREGGRGPQKHKFAYLGQFSVQTTRFNYFPTIYYV